MVGIVPAMGPISIRPAATEKVLGPEIWIFLLIFGYQIQPSRFVS